MQSHWVDYLTDVRLWLSWNWIMLCKTQLKEKLRDGHHVPEACPSSHDKTSPAATKGVVLPPTASVDPQTFTSSYRDPLPPLCNLLDFNPPRWTGSLVCGWSSQCYSSSQTARRWQIRPDQTCSETNLTTSLRGFFSCLLYQVGGGVN